MADEALTGEDEARALVALGGCALFNLRLSKLGGMAAARRIARIADEAGIGLQVGCQVGESAILSAAGRMLAASLDHPVALEGSYGTLLLEEDLSVAPFSFGSGGSARLQEGPGLGIDIDAERVRRLAAQSRLIE
jgi:L-alanine-DL-glutamate epimerase-like enolase superfamily enzyme